MAPVFAFQWMSASSWSGERRSSAGGRRLALPANSVCAGGEDDAADVVRLSAALCARSLRSWRGFCASFCVRWNLKHCTMVWPLREQNSHCAVELDVLSAVDEGSDVPTAWERFISWFWKASRMVALSSLS